MRLYQLLEIIEDTAKNIPKDELELLYKKSFHSVQVNSSGNLYCNRDIDLRNWGTFKEIYLEEQGDGYIVKYPMELVIGNFNAFNEKILSMRNFPMAVRGNVEVGLNNLSDLEGVPAYIDKKLSLESNRRLTSFAGIGKMVKECKEIVFPSELKRNLLGCILIKNLENITNDDDEMTFDELDKELQDACRVINKHLAFGRDLLECQEEMIEMGAKEYAKL